MAAASAALAAPRGANGGANTGGCGGTRPEHLALKLAPCAQAVEDPNATPSGSCCAAVRDIWKRQTPDCLCAMILSDTVKHAGIKVEVAITIPKRCNIASRPVGYKCGEYTLPSMQN
ncbi:hypothetical protein PR202_gb15721 [Eleusine coracana subsp. coracana]|uniref:Bifunctional inhibitor/plant lipid transfer protein/seed storage helical domain-containing protein n=1 Tax=Eleusine coracana subsp. coracana TaxID=191504 RepID=A0AAV5EYL8_ELECO|nr:hypothetical protein QOZ80_4BG0349630 [Eleusine coracana subsp. coracana]GJN27679.1 hypothetical protein PR202_gb15721 [Eleusine coracana subsp. coracana]